MNETIIVYLVLNALFLIGFIVFSVESNHTPFYTRRYIGRYDESESVPNQEFEGWMTICGIGAILFGVLLAVESFDGVHHWSAWYLVGAIITLTIGVLINKKIEDEEKINIAIFALIVALVTLMLGLH